MIIFLLSVIALTLLLGPEAVMGLFKFAVKLCFLGIFLIALAVVSLKGFV